jgi:hypothetical protein
LCGLPAAIAILRSAPDPRTSCVDCRIECLCNTSIAGSLNYRDVLVAFGRASSDANSEGDLGMDFSGRVGARTFIGL